MAEKEATVYIVDVGRSMGERHHGRPVTDLEWTMQYVWDKITTTVCGTSANIDNESNEMSRSVQDVRQLESG